MSHGRDWKAKNAAETTRLKINDKYFIFSGASRHKLYIFIYITPSHHTNRNYQLFPFACLYQTMSILHWKEADKHSQKENKQKCIFIYLQTFIFFFLVLISRSIATHFSPLCVGGKTTLQRDFLACSVFFTFPTNMYTYTLYIYILCVSTSQTKMEGWGGARKYYSSRRTTTTFAKWFSRKKYYCELLPFSHWPQSKRCLEH